MKKVTLWDWCHAVFFSQNARHTGTSQLKPCRHCFGTSFHAWLLKDLETTFLLNHCAMFSNSRIHRKRFIRHFRNLKFPTTAVPQNSSLAILKYIGTVHKWRHTPEGRGSDILWRCVTRGRAVEKRDVTENFCLTYIFPENTKWNILNKVFRQWTK